MASIGFFLDILDTGKIVPINETKRLRPNIKNICLNPKFKIVNKAPKSSRIILFIKNIATLQAATDKTKFNKVIITLSLKKSPKTSEPLAPRALKIPISCFL